MRSIVILFVFLAGCMGYDDATIILDGVELHYAPGELVVRDAGDGEWGLLSIKSNVPVTATIDGQAYEINEAWSVTADRSMRDGDVLRLCLDRPASSVLLSIGNDHSEATVEVQMGVC